MSNAAATNSKKRVRTATKPATELAAKYDYRPCADMELGEPVKFVVGIKGNKDCLTDLYSLIYEFRNSTNRTI